MTSTSVLRTTVREARPEEANAVAALVRDGYTAYADELPPDLLRRWVDDVLARQILYADCDDGAASAAIERLRPQAQTPYDEPCVLDALPRTPCTYVVCGEDRLVNPDWSRRIANERLGADLIELPGSHSPFLSRPNELAAVLHDRQ